MKKILLLGSQHGNELLGEKLYHHIKNNRPELSKYISYKVGNLRAKKASLRYIETDLNRSYNCGQKTYEQRRSKRIIKYINNNQFDLVLDLHTTTCDQSPCIIIPSINPDNSTFLNATFIDKIIHMDMDVVKQSLIGTYPKSVSIEVSKKQLKPGLLNKLADDIDRYIKSENNNRTAIVYQVRDFIHKDKISEELAAKLNNFELCNQGFYPVLVGEKSYKKQTNYLGFKAINTYDYKIVKN